MSLFPIFAAILSIWWIRRCLKIIACLHRDFGLVSESMEFLAWYTLTWVESLVNHLIQVRQIKFEFKGTVRTAQVGKKEIKWMSDIDFEHSRQWIDGKWEPIPPGRFMIPLARD